MRTDAKRGQALIELGFGMFALILVVSALATFAVYIAHALRAENTLRATLGTDGGTRSASDSVSFDAPPVKGMFGKDAIPIRERVSFPSR